MENLKLTKAEIEQICKEQNIDVTMPFYIVEVNTKSGSTNVKGKLFWAMTESFKKTRLPNNDLNLFFRDFSDVLDDNLFS